MSQDTTAQCRSFPESVAKPLVVRFDDWRRSPDGGVILLKAADERHCHDVRLDGEGGSRDTDAEIEYTIMAPM